MTREQFINTITFLGVAYNKSFSKEEMEVWYEMLKGYNEEVLNKVVKSLVKTEKFLPAISTIIEKCNEFKPLDRFEVLERMRERNYFKTVEEYLKAKEWLTKGLMPEWFKKDMQKFYDVMLVEDNTRYIKAEEKPKLLDNNESFTQINEYFECANCHELRLIEERGSTEVCLQDNVCIYCQEQGYGVE